jgi:hypothetical protein
MKAKQEAAEQAREASKAADNDYIAAQWDFSQPHTGVKI